MRPRGSSPAIWVAAIAMCATTAAVTVSGSASEYAWLEAVFRVLTVATPIAVGVLAFQRHPFERFGGLLIATGSVVFLTTLAGSDDATLHSIGRLAGWASEPLLVYLILGFPTGRLDHRIDRALVWSLVLVVAVLYVPTAFLVERYPVPNPTASCVQTCAENAFMVVASEPAVVDDLVRPLRELLTIALFVAVTARLAYRTRATSRLMRPALVPVLAVACFRCALFAGALLERRRAPGSDATEAAAWLLALTVPLTALAFLAGLALWWVYIARSMQRLAARLHDRASPEDLRDGLAEAFGDPSLHILYQLGDDGGHWGDADGHPLDPPAAGPGRAVSTIRQGDHVLAAIVHDAALEDDRAFIDTASSYAAMTLENHRLSAQASSLLRAVRESRARIQAAADDERRRIERDLHDGAQQQLVALRIKLALAAERRQDGRGDRDEGAVELRALGDDVEHALEEIRSLARGIYPASLANRGLVEGLRAAALRSALPTTILAAGVRRHAREVESAMYFCALEALQNAAKHADGASAVVVELRDDGCLRLEVRDDGAGFEPDVVPCGVGLTSMRDRLAAVGGHVAIASSPGRGTRVTATVPLAAEAH